MSPIVNTVHSPSPPSLSGLAARSQSIAADSAVKIAVEHLNFYYGTKRALEDISISIGANVVSAFIGPSGCGKSTFLRTLNRMNDIIADTRVEGGVHIDGANIYAPGTDVVDLRRRVGMVFQK
jgi:phosphate transport system ATP-binding protein